MDKTFKKSFVEISNSHNAKITYINRKLALKYT